MPNAIVILITLLFVAAVIAWQLARRKASERPVRVMLFVAYFWLLAFAEVMLAVLAYLGWQHFQSL